MALAAARACSWSILGQFSFLATITTLVIAARLRKFDIALEEAALNLGAEPRRGCSPTMTLPFLAPALIGAFLVGFLVSFENFNTTLMLVGSDAPLTITMYDRDGQGRRDAGAERRLVVPDARLGAAGAARDRGAAAKRRRS